MQITLHPIAHAENGFVSKFGIPRQSREESCIETRIVMEKTYAKEEAFRGIEEYDWLWIVWGFHEAGASDKLTVRPPRLGGNTRMGVFATRSPFRPNPIGLTSVRLLRVEQSADGICLVVKGADLLNGTPIYDIKPYIAYSDAHEEARSGFGEKTKDYELQIEWTAKTRQQAGDLADELTEILRQDPRPSYQEDEERIYGMSYANKEVHFRVAHGILQVVAIENTSK